MEKLLIEESWVLSKSNNDCSAGANHSQWEANNILAEASTSLTAAAEFCKHKKYASVTKLRTRLREATYRLRRANTPNISSCLSWTKGEGFDMVRGTPSGGLLKRSSESRESCFHFCFAWKRLRNCCFNKFMRGLSYLFFLIGHLLLAITS